MTKKKKVILVVLAVMLLVGTLIYRGLNLSFAAGSSELPETLTSKSGDPSSDGATLIEGLFNNSKYLEDSSGTRYVAYCLNKEKGWPNDHTLQKSASPLDNGYAYMVLNGYPSKSLTGNAKNDLYLTQIALWFYQDRANGVDDGSDGVLTAQEKQKIMSSQYYEPYIKKLIDGALSAKTTGVTPNPIFTVNSSSFKLSSDHQYLITDVIAVTSNITFPSYKVSLNNDKYEVLDELGSVVSSGNSINYGKGFKIRVPLSAVKNADSKSLKISIIVDYTQSDTYLYQPQAGDSSASNIQDVAIAALVATEKQKVAETTVSLPLGSLTIKKVADGHDENLEGAQIQVKRVATDEVVKTFTTSSNAEVISDLLPGEYTVTELTPPTGYTIDSVKNVVISDSNLTPSTTLTDKKLTVRVKKVNGEGKAIPGAVIGIYRSSDNHLVKSINSGDDYVEANDIGFGNYYAQEITAPAGYKKDSTKHEFSLSDENLEAEITITNVLNSTDILKVDEEGQPLAGAVLKIVDSNGTEKDTFTSTTSPHRIEGLEAGTYYVEEVSAPSGYKKSTTRKQFTITEDQQVTQTITFENVKNGLSITKVDESSLPIAGARLRVYNDSGYSYEFETTAKATVIQGLASGTYHVAEVSAPDGFVKSNEVKDVVINDTDQANASVSFPNKRNVIKVAKIDADSGTYLAGATMQLLDSDGSLVDSWVSTAQAHTISSLTLKHGTYTLKEIKAPTGYILNTEAVTINIDENSDNEHVYTMSDKKIDVEVLKVDNLEKPLAGVTLTLLDANKQTLNKTWTTTTNPYKLEDLSEGTYYIQEVSTIDGYILDKSLKKIEINSSNPKQTVKFTNKPIVLELAKIDFATNQMIAGATLKLSREDGGMEPITWVSNNTVKTITGIKAGTYILEEIKAPEGYVSSASKIVFEVKNTGEVQRVSMKSNYVTLKVVNKKLNVDTNGVKDFKFKLEDKTGKEIESWTSDGSIHVSKALTNGEYILREISVPDGYIKSTGSYPFNVSDSENLDVVKLLNDIITVNISKKDITNGEEVEGAELVLKNSNGDVIDTWVSKKEAHVITKLPVGKYKLTETIAPDGYVLNKSTVEFEVLETGQVQAQTMYNQPIIDVPDTAKYVAKWVYVVAVILLCSGLGIIFMAYRRNKFN